MAFRDVRDKRVDDRSRFYANVRDFRGARVSTLTRHVCVVLSVGLLNMPAVPLVPALVVPPPVPAVVPKAGSAGRQ